MSFKIFGRDSLGEKILCGFAVAFFNFVMFAYFFARNTSELTPQTAGILAAILFALAIVSYIPALIIFRRAFTAMTFCVFAWLGFFLSQLIIKFFLDHWPWSNTRAISMTASIMLVALFCTIFLRKLQNTKKATLFFIGVLAVIFTMNLGKILETISNAIEVSNTNIPIKKIS